MTITVQALAMKLDSLDFENSISVKLLSSLILLKTLKNLLHSATNVKAIKKI